MQEKFDICKRKVRFLRQFCKSGRYSANLCLRISKKSSKFAAKLRWWAKIKENKTAN